MIHPKTKIMLYRKKKRAHHKMNIFPLVSLFFIGALFVLSTSYSEKWIFKWQGIRTEIKDSIQALDKYGVLTSKFVVHGRASNQWHRQNWLQKTIHTHELIKLTEYPSGTVKGFAYSELMRISEIEKYPLYKEILNDTLSFVLYSPGHSTANFMLSEFTLQYTLNFENLDLKKQLTDLQFKEIDSLLKLRLRKKDFYRRLYEKLQ
jgi:hypothetical protein